MDKGQRSISGCSPTALARRVNIKIFSSRVAKKAPTLSDHQMVEFWDKLRHNDLIQIKDDIGKQWYN